MTKTKQPDDLPPSVSSEEIERMVEEMFRKNNADWLSPEVDFTGAGPQPLDDSVFDDL